MMPRSLLFLNIIYIRVPPDHAWLQNLLPINQPLSRMSPCPLHSERRRSGSPFLPRRPPPKDSKNESRKDAIINVLGGIIGILLAMIILIIACLTYLIVRYYRDVYAAGGGGGEKGTKPKLPSSDAGTQTINNDLIWQISTEENISYNLMANPAKNNPPSKLKVQLQPPAPVVVSNHFTSPAAHVGKEVHVGKKSKRPPPLPKTE